MREGLTVIFLLHLALVGAIASCSDVRHFSRIEADCRERGYLQDEETRVICSVEPKLKEPK